MSMKRSNAVLSALLVIVLMMLAGCQQVGGLDVNKVLTSSFSVKSAESKHTVTVELTPDAASLTPDERTMFELFGKTKLEITEAKMQDRLHASMKGTLEYAKGRIPFTLAMADQVYTIQIEGAKKPLVVRGGTAALNSSASPRPISKELHAQLEQLTQKAADAAPSLASFITRSLPNPNKISVLDVTEAIHGESIPLQKLHAEIYGSELIGLVKGFLTNVLADEQGLKDFIGQMYDLYVPLLLAAVKESEGAIENNPMADSFLPYLQNKNLAVEFIFTFLKTNLQQVLASYDQRVAELFASERGTEAKAWLNDNQYVKMDIYADRDGMPRKTASELLLTAPAGSSDGLKSVKVTTTAEMWNIGKPVTADKIDTSAGVIDLNGDTGRLTPSKIVASLDPGSQLYKLLKDDLQVTKKQILMLMSDNNDYGFGIKPYNDNGTVMVPARFVSEQLDGDVQWDAEAKQVTITDPLSGAVMMLWIGSREAAVNGKPVTLEKAAALVDGNTYIPLRFVSESMGAKVGWEQSTQTVSITRD